MRCEHRILLGSRSKLVQTNLKHTQRLDTPGIWSYRPSWSHFSPYRSKIHFWTVVRQERKNRFFEKVDNKIEYLFFVFILLKRTHEARHFELLFARIGSRSSKNETKEGSKCEIFIYCEIQRRNSAMFENPKFENLFCFVLRAPWTDSGEQ